MPYYFYFIEKICLNLKISWQKRLTANRLTEMCMHSCELLRVNFLYRSFLHKAYHSNAHKWHDRKMSTAQQTNVKSLKPFFLFSVFFLSFLFYWSAMVVWLPLLFTYRYSHFLWANMHDEIVSLGRTIHYKYWLWLQLEAVTCVCLADWSLEK